MRSRSITPLHSFHFSSIRSPMKLSSSWKVDTIRVASGPLSPELHTVYVLSYFIRLVQSAQSLWLAACHEYGDSPAMCLPSTPKTAYSDLTNGSIPLKTYSARVDEIPRAGEDEPLDSSPICTCSEQPARSSQLAHHLGRVCGLRVASLVRLVRVPHKLQGDSRCNCGK